MSTRYTVTLNGSAATIWQYGAVLAEITPDGPVRYATASIDNAILTAYKMIQKNHSDEISTGKGLIMPKPHIHAALIKAWADGAEIQAYDQFNNNWLYIHTPAWEEDVIYRIKPNDEISTDTPTSTP